ncbi:IS4 family transposase, partial [Priestia flexa]|nr:IS4 family transposase [Priestia flexa]MEC0668264.1 IS4 family transposase [Priestia flexa]MEC0668425.1 IS4 family transposase [Priestia flexa]MEC0668454.1 IS4 family transposase [Priestia flexa]MEC0668526.1 IS4 family transposase [Priestia flexa]
TTENAVFNQLFAALITYVLLKWLYTKTSERQVFKTVSFVTFQRQLVGNNLPIDWQSEMSTFLKNYVTFQGISLSNFG